MSDPVTFVDVTGAGGFVAASQMAFDAHTWGKVQDTGTTECDRSSISMVVPVPLQTVHHAEIWSAILALQAFLQTHVGIDNLSVVNLTAP